MDVAVKDAILASTSNRAAHTARRRGIARMRRVSALRTVATGHGVRR